MEIDTDLIIAIEDVLTMNGEGHSLMTLRICWLEHKVAVREQQIAGLVQYVDQLEGQLRQLEPSSTMAQLEPTHEVSEIIEEPSVAAVDQPASAELKTVLCRYGCGATFKNAAGRSIHEGKAHGGPWGTTTATAVAIDDDRLFTCAECGSNTFARSLTQHDRCMRCASAARNGAHAVLP